MPNHAHGCDTTTARPNRPPQQRRPTPRPCTCDKATPNRTPPPTPTPTHAGMGPTRLVEAGVPESGAPSALPG